MKSSFFLVTLWLLPWTIVPSFTTANDLAPEPDDEAGIFVQYVAKENRGKASWIPVRHVGSLKPGGPLIEDGTTTNNDQHGQDIHKVFFPQAYVGTNDNKSYLRIGERGRDGHKNSRGHKSSDYLVPPPHYNNHNKNEETMLLSSFNNNNINERSLQDITLPTALVGNTCGGNNMRACCVTGPCIEHDNSLKCQTGLKTVDTAIPQDCSLCQHGTFATTEVCRNDEDYSYLCEETEWEQCCGGYNKRACCDCEIKALANTEKPIEKCVGQGRVVSPWIQSFDCSDLCSNGETTNEVCLEPPRPAGECDPYQFDSVFEGWTNCCGNHGEVPCCEGCVDDRDDYCATGITRLPVSHAYPCVAASSCEGMVNEICLDLRPSVPTFCGNSGQRPCCPCEIDRFADIERGCHDIKEVPIPSMLIDQTLNDPESGHCFCLPNADEGDRFTNAGCADPNSICGNLGQRACCDCEIELGLLPWLTGYCHFDELAIPVPSLEFFDCNCFSDILGTNLICERALQCGEEGQRACCETEVDLYDVPACESGLVTTATNVYQVCLGVPALLTNMVCVNATVEAAKSPPPPPLDPEDYECLADCGDCDYVEQCVLNYNNMVIVSQAARLSDIVYNLTCNGSNATVNATEYNTTKASSCNITEGDNIFSFFESEPSQGAGAVVVKADGFDGYCYFAFRGEEDFVDVDVEPDGNESDLDFDFDFEQAVQNF